MPKIKLPMIRGDRESNYDYRSFLPVNLTAVSRNIKGYQGYLISHDGLKEFATTGGVARGGTFNKKFEKHFRVSGDFLESVSPDGTITELGLVPGDGICSLAESFNTQAILSDGKVYLWDSATLRQITDPDLGFPIDITQFRGIYVMTDGQFLFHTDINNEFSISPLKYSSSEFSSDKILAVERIEQNKIVAFNRYSTEYFYFDPTVPSGTSVLRVIDGASNNIGIVGTHCQTVLDGMFFILGGRAEESPSIHILNSGQESTVATREIAKALSKYTESELSKAYLESRTVDNDKFLIVHLPCETLLYNHTVAKVAGIDGAWSILDSNTNPSNTDKSYPWRAKFGVFDPRAAKWVYGDTLENKLCYLDDKSAAQYGEQVESICYTPIIPDLETFSINSFEIDTIAGFVSSEFSSSFSLSYDGVTHGKEYWNKISAPDTYNKRYIARNLGYVRNDFSMKFRFVSGDKMAFSGLVVDYS